MRGEFGFSILAIWFFFEMMATLVHLSSTIGGNKGLALSWYFFWVAAIFFIIGVLENG